MIFLSYLHLKFSEILENIWFIKLTVYFLEIYMEIELTSFILKNTLVVYISDNKYVRSRIFYTFLIVISIESETMYRSYILVNMNVKLNNDLKISRGTNA